MYDILDIMSEVELFLLLHTTLHVNSFNVARDGLRRLERVFFVDVVFAKR